MQSELAQIGSYCIGSPGHRRSHASRFRRAVANLPADDLSRWLVESHLTGLFVEAAGELDAGSPPRQIANALEPRLRLERAFHTHLLAELHNLGALLSAPANPPILMKGISHWPYYADGLGTRRIRDLDVLVLDAEAGDGLCDALESAGFESLTFEGDERDARQHLRTGVSFSAPPYRVRRRIELSLELEAALRERPGPAGSGVELQWIEDIGAVVTVDVEIHAALFRAETGALVRLAPGRTGPDGLAPGFDALAAGPAMAYAATKFSLDMIETLASGEVGAKCLKLGADAIRILMACRQPDLDAAFAVAQEWDCLHHLLDVLRGISPLAPELELLDIPGAESGSLLTAFLEQVRDPAGAHADA